MTKRAVWLLAISVVTACGKVPADAGANAAIARLGDDECPPGLQDAEGDGVCRPSCAALGSRYCSAGFRCDDTTGDATCVGRCAEGEQDRDGDGTCEPSCAALGPEHCGGFGICDDQSGIAVCHCLAHHEGPACASCESGFVSQGAACVPSANDEVAGVDGACPAGRQDNDGDGTCKPTCATLGAAHCGTFGSCDDEPGIAVCHCLEHHTGRGCASCASGFVEQGEQCVAAEGAEEPVVPVIPVDDVLAKTSRHWRDWASGTALVRLSRVEAIEPALREALAAGQARLVAIAGAAHGTATMADDETVRFEAQAPGFVGTEGLQLEIEWNDARLAIELALTSTDAAPLPSGSLGGAMMSEAEYRRQMAEGGLRVCPWGYDPDGDPVTVRLPGLEEGPGTGCMLALPGGYSAFGMPTVCIDVVLSDGMLETAAQWCETFQIYPC